MVHLASGMKYQNQVVCQHTDRCGITDVARENFVPRKGVIDDTLSNAVAFSRMGTQVKRLFTIQRYDWNTIKPSTAATGCRHVLVSASRKTKQNRIMRLAQFCHRRPGKCTNRCRCVAPGRRRCLRLELDERT